MQDSGAKLLITSRRFDGVLEGVTKALPDLPVWRLGDEGEADFVALVARQPDTLIDDPAPGLDMLYSSGTTGRPKGIRNTTPHDPDFTVPHPFLMVVHNLFGVPADGQRGLSQPRPALPCRPVPLGTGDPPAWRAPSS